MASKTYSVRIQRSTYHKLCTARAELADYGVEFRQPRLNQGGGKRRSCSSHYITWDNIDHAMTMIQVALLVIPPAYREIKRLLVDAGLDKDEIIQLQLSSKPPKQSQKPEKLGDRRDVTRMPRTMSRSVPFTPSEPLAASRDQKR